MDALSQLDINGIGFVKRVQALSIASAAYKEANEEDPIHGAYGTRAAESATSICGRRIPMLEIEMHFQKSEFQVIPLL